MKYLVNIAHPFLPSPRNNLRQHVRGVGEDDLGLDVFRPLHVDAHRAGRPTRQGLLLLDLDLLLDLSHLVQSKFGDLTPQTAGFCY